MSYVRTNAGEAIGVELEASRTAASEATGSVGTGVCAACGNQPCGTVASMYAKGTLVRICNRDKHFQIQLLNLKHASQLKTIYMLQSTRLNLFRVG